jgi:excisionase family DNA binding protein
MTLNELKALLSVNEAAALAGISRQMIYKGFAGTKYGKLEYIRIGKKRLIHRNALERWRILIGKPIPIRRKKS